MQSRKYCLEIFYVGVLIPPAAISVYDTYINIYIDTSVLLENSPLVESSHRKLHPGRRIFHILTSEDIKDVIFRFWLFLYFELWIRLFFGYIIK